MMQFPESWSKLDVALCHDWLTGMRGGERVLELLCRAFPDAPIDTLVYNPAAVSETINRHAVRASLLRGVPGICRHYRSFLPLFPWTIERFPPVDAALLISTSHCVAKARRHAPHCRHLCYCFTPMRYAWRFQNEYFGTRGLKAHAIRLVLSRLRRWDRAVSGRVDRFVAISEHVRERIESYYGREADVVYPPVDIDRWTPGPQAAGTGDFDLIVSALVPYKRVDLAVEAYTRSGRALRIVGTGTEYERLAARAGRNVRFMGWQTDAAILALYRQCRALIFPGEEDFGIVPLEAQACGKPVVALGRGGALETVRDETTGLFFPEQTPEALNDAVARCHDRPWDGAAIRAHAETFGPSTFIEGLAAAIERCLAQP